MSFPSFYSLSSAWLFLFLIPLIIFYFLKLKRPRVDIPSLVLWRQVINDQRVNSPFQKFKRNFLLLLQLLLLMFLVLAAMQPFLQAGAERAEYLPVLIDCSASMGARGEPDGKTRLEIAKQQVRELIDNLLPDQRVTLIAVGSTARRMTEFTDNKTLLREGLDRIDVLDVPSNIEDSLRMAQALSRTVPIETVVIYTDGNIPERVDFELPFDLNYQQLPVAGPNQGITALNARRSRSDQWDVFVRVAASSAEPLTGEVEVIQDGQAIGNDRVDLAAGGSQRLVFRLQSDSDSAVEVRLNPDGTDSLSSDNLAFLNLPRGRPLTVYCPQDLASYRHALGALSGLQLFPNAKNPESPASYDLVLTDEAGTDIEATVALYVGVVPEDLKPLVKVESGVSEVIDWRRNSPLLQHIQFFDVILSDDPQSADGVQESDYESLGYEILAHGRAGPLILKNRNGPRVSYHMLFHTDRSTLPYRVGFPILVSNLIQITLREAELSEVRGNASGVLPSLVLTPNQQFRVVGPGNTIHVAESDNQGVVNGVPAPLVGRYEFQQSGSQAARIGVGLLSPRESSLAAVEDIQFRELAVSAADTQVKNDRPLWPFLAMAGFLLLLVEWWYFNRRPVSISAAT